MIEELFENNKRTQRIQHIDTDLLVAGGGMAGVCAAIAAARQGLRVALVQDRPVLGGNASSEVRLWVLGATSHMGNNNRWAREGGLLNELLVENTYRNKEGNPVIFDTVLLDKVLAENNISLFLNTVVYDMEKKGPRNIARVTAYNPQNETRYIFNAKLFCDATGDGLLAYMAGAQYRQGAEDAEEFGENFAPNKETYGEKLGHTIFFYIKDAGKPVQYVPPHFALSINEVESSINKIHNPEYFSTKEAGCKYWWIEYGGRLDTIKDTEEVKYRLLSVVYGIWNYIKNSGRFPESRNLTLEWAGTIPGKRESRRFVGYYMLTQQDIIEQRMQPDAVAFGGWSLDLHPADGVFSKEKKACTQWHAKGIYPIPYRCYITPHLDNLFLAGRIISATHVAFASTRVMATCAAGGEAVGTAAAYCIHHHCTPDELMDEQHMAKLQTLLTRNGVYLPQTDVQIANNALQTATIKASSTLVLDQLPPSGKWKTLVHSAAQMLPISKGAMPNISLWLRAGQETSLQVELRISSKTFNHTPDQTLETVELPLHAGEQEVTLAFKCHIPSDCYAFVCFMKNEHVALQACNSIVSGVMATFNKCLPAVSNWGKQEPPAHIGVESFEFWCPERREKAYNIAMKITPGLRCFAPENLLAPPYRPVNKPNAWVAALHDKQPTLTLTWENEQQIKGIKLFTDVDYDHPMETVQWGHADNRMPQCVDGIEIIASPNTHVTITNNYQAMIDVAFEGQGITTNRLEIRLSNASPNVAVALMGIQFI